MNYLSPSEYEAYGLEATLPASWVAAASSLLDAYCRRGTLGVAQYVERTRLTPSRNAVRLSYLPLAALAPATTPLVSVRARYAVPRRGEGGHATVTGTIMSGIGDLAYDVAQVFALPGTWVDLDPSSLDYFAETGEVTFAINVLGLSYNEYEITYTAGLIAIPDAVKFACAQVIRNAQATPALNVRSGSIDRMHMDYFSDSLFDTTVCALLAPYVAQRVA